MIDGPCEAWAFDMPCDVVDVDPGVLALVKEAATFVLWSRSGRRYGTCTLMLRPSTVCAYGSGWPRWGAGYTPRLRDGVWVNCTDGCDSTKGVYLGGPVPVASIEQVLIDGAVLDDEVYRWVEGSQILYRVDGADWPTKQDVALAETEVGTWAIEVKVGLDVDPLGLMAAGEVACEILKATKPGSDCKLPSRVTGLTRQGVSLSFATPTEIAESERLGLELADLWLDSVNPDRLRCDSQVWSVDRMPQR